MKKPRSSLNDRGSSSSGPSSLDSTTRKRTAGRLVMGAEPVAAGRAEVATRAKHELHEQLLVPAHRATELHAVERPAVATEVRGPGAAHRAEDAERHPVPVEGRRPATLVVEVDDVAAADA